MRDADRITDLAAGELAIVLDAVEAVFVAFDAWRGWPGWRNDDIGPGGG